MKVQKIKRESLSLISPLDFRGSTITLELSVGRYRTSLHGKQMGKEWKQWQTLLFGAPKSLQIVIAAQKNKV